MSPRTAFAAPSRRGFALSAAEGRRQWLEFLTVAQLQADRAARGFARQPDEMVALARLVRRLSTPFPVRQMTAVLVSAAATMAAAALSEAVTLDDREAVAAVLLPAVAFLERVVAEDNRSRAELSRRIAGDSDDGG